MRKRFLICPKNSPAAAASSQGVPAGIGAAIAQRQPQEHKWTFIGAEVAWRNMVWLLTCLLLAYFTANVIVAVRVNVFALAGGRKPKLILYTLAFLLEGSIIMLGIGLIAAMRRLDNDSA